MVIGRAQLSSRRGVRLFVRAGVLSVGLCIFSTPLAAQTGSGTQTPPTPTPAPFNIAPPSRVERPYRGVLGAPNPNVVPVLTLEGMIGGGLLSGNPVVEQTTGVPGGNFGQGEGGTGAGTGSATFEFAFNRRRWGFNATNVSIADYYPRSTTSSFLARDIESGAFHFIPFRPTTVTIAQTFKNLPEFAWTDLHGGDFTDVVPLIQDLGLTVDRYTRYGAELDVAHKLSRRSTLTGSIGYAHGMISSRAWTIITASGDFSHALGKGLSARAGYSYGGQRDQSANGARGARESHPRIDAGIDYSRALSFARRTRLSFATGTAGTQDRSEHRTIYHFVGSARLEREFGRTWNAALIFARDARYIEQVDEPLFRDSLGVIVSGSLNRRTEVKSSFGATSGRVGASGGTSFDTYFASTQLSIALSRTLGFGADYAYSWFASPYSPDQIAAFGKLSQHGLRAYIKLWAPLVTRPRQP